MTDSLPPVSSPSPSPGSPSSPPPRVSLVQDVGATVVSLASIAAILAAWKWGLLAGVPTWAPLAGIVLCGLPVSIRARILGSLLPARQTKE